MNLHKFEQRNEMQNLTIMIGRYTTDGFRMAYPHWHPHYELTIILKPIACEVTNNSVVVRSERPMICIHRPYTVHMIRTGFGEYLRVIIRFASQYIADIPSSIVDLSSISASDLACAYPNEAELAEFEEMSMRIRKFNDDGDFSSAKLRTAELLHRILLILDSGRGERFSGGISYIQDILRIIGENLSEPKTIEELCREFDVGASKLCADFKRHTGSTYKKYLTDLRMTRARELLASGSNIINASLETGYSSEAHFIKAFREYYGITPGGMKERL